MIIFIIPEIYFKLSIFPLVCQLYNNNKKTSILTKEEFGFWLSGFIDAEGNFQVYLDRKYIRVLFRIVLHVDDIKTLACAPALRWLGVPQAREKIRDYLKTGTVRISGNSCIYSIYKVEEIINILIPFLDQYTLITTKYLDFLDFKNVANLIIRNSSSISEHSKSNIVNIIAQMNSTRTIYDISLIPSKNIKPFWLLGFIEGEGEGTFGFKNLVPYFQIGQHGRSLMVLENIKLYLESIPKVTIFSKFETTLNFSKTLHKDTNVYVISLSNIDALHDYLVPFLLSMPFQTRKATDFSYWNLGIYLHKYGYIYLPEGRTLVNEISKSINKNRYSNSIIKSNLPDLISIKKVLDFDLPIKLSIEMTHLNLALKYAKLKKLREIWAYDGGNLIKGSPFFSYSEANRQLGFKSNSEAIRRNIDTGKFYLKRYSFYSSQQ